VGWWCGVGFVVWFTNTTLHLQCCAITGAVPVHGAVLCGAGTSHHCMLLVQSQLSLSGYFKLLSAFPLSTLPPSVGLLSVRLFVCISVLYLYRDINAHTRAILSL
jgi:hypothetical protein